MSELTDLQEFRQRVTEPSATSTVKSRGSSAVARDPSCDSSADNIKDTQMWAVYGGRSYSPCEKAVMTMPAGQYTIEVSNQLGIHFKRTETNLDDLVSLPDSVSEEVIKEIENFWQKEDHFRKFGFLWKRGVLMWGPPGGGKTTTLQVISDRVIKRNGLSIYVNDPDLAAKGLNLLRLVEPTRPLVVMLEDVDAIIDHYSESSLLALMDGELQIDNVVFVATTNYPERLDKRFINRPSRFDIIKKIGMPNEQARRTYLTAKNTRLASKQFADELSTWVAKTKNFSVAHLKELIVSVEVFGVPLQHAIDRLQTMMEYSPKSADGNDHRSVGFTD